MAKAGDGLLWVLDLTEPTVREAVLAFEGGKVTSLYEAEVGRPYR